MRVKPFQKRLIFSALIIVAMTLAACSGGSTPTPAATTAPTTGAGGAAPTPSAGSTSAAGSVPATGATQPASAPSTGGTSSANAKNPGTLIEGNIADPSSLDPNWAYDTASGEVIYNVYQTLLFYNKGSATTFVPMLATSWDVSKDGKTYTFHIRQGVKFQEGQTLTPEDVAYSLWRLMIQDRAGGPSWILLQPFFGLNVQTFQSDVVKAQYGGDFAKATQAVEQAVTFDNSAMTVTMHLKQPFGPMLETLAGYWASILSKSWAISHGGWNGDPATAQKYHDPAANADELFKIMNGTGPYEFVRWQPNQEVDLKANPNYWQTQPLWPGGPSGEPKETNVIIKDIPEWGTRFAALKAGDLDLAYVDQQYESQIDPLVGTACDANGNCNTSNAGQPFKVFKNLPSTQATTIFMNQAVNTTGGSNYLGSGKLDGNGIPANFFSDTNIRKAFNDCFDWNTYIKQVYFGEAQQAYGPIISGELGYNANQAHFSFDLNQCAADFKASTLKSADGKSLWDTGFYVQYVYNLGNDQRQAAGQLLAQELAKVNPKFKVSVVGEPFPVELADQTAGRLPLFMLGWLEDYHDPNDWVGPYLQTGGTYGGTQGFPKALQSQMDTLVTQAVTSTSDQTRASDYSQLQNLSYQNALDIFVVQPLNRQYLQNWVQGFYYNPALYTMNYFYALSK